MVASLAAAEILPTVTAVVQPLVYLNVNFADVTTDAGDEHLNLNAYVNPV